MLLIVALVVLLAFLIAAVAIWWYQKYSRFFRLINKIPGPKGVPIFGNFGDYNIPLEKLFRDDRERNLKYFPIYKQWILHVGAVSLLKPEDLEIVLSSTKHIKKSRIYDIFYMWLGTGLLTSYGEKWRMRRKMLTPGFHFNILQGFIDIFNQETENLVKSLQKHIHEPFIDVVSPITDFTLKSMSETSMGISLNLENGSNKSYKKALLEFSQIAIYRMTRPWLYNDNIFRFSWKSLAAYKHVKILHNFTQNVINERKKSFRTATESSYSSKKRQAMLDRLLTAKEEGLNIDDDGIREEVDTFMFEGHDTTSIAITFILLTLANHKEVQEEIRQEIIDIMGDSDQPPTYSNLQELAYTERCIKECLRLYPSVAFIARDAMEDIHTTSGYVIPKGAMIHIHIFDLHRNPTLYPDPEKFDPDRFLPENIQKRHPFAYIPFSAGPRNCIGQKFAMLELKAVLCGILRNFVLEPVDKPEDIVFTTDIVLRNSSIKSRDQMVFLFWVLSETTQYPSLVLSNPKFNKKSKIYDVTHMWLGTGLLVSHGEKWRIRRRMLTPTFHFTILQDFIEIFNEETAVLVKNLQKCLHEPFINVAAPITEFTLKSMMETSMGISLNLENETIKNYKKSILVLGQIFLYRAVRPWLYNDKIFRFSWKSFTAYKHVKILHNFTQNVIKERKKAFKSTTKSSYMNKKRLAMLDLLLTAKEEGANIDDEGIREEVDTFLFEGHDTTSIAITFILLMLANHEEVQEEIRQEIIEIVGDSDQPPTYYNLQELSYTERCIKECLRLYPSVAFIARDAMEDIHTTSGYVVPKGAMIHIHIFDLHRNPTLYPDPEKFDPDRFLPENVQKRHPFAYIPFSAGPRNCIGQRFAMLELKAVLCGILRKFVLKPFDRPEDIVFISDIVLRAKNQIRSLVGIFNENPQIKRLAMLDLMLIAKEEGTNMDDESITEEVSTFMFE
ncbi:p450 domain containing protein, partial [Asbolus verrucosus]